MVAQRILWAETEYRSNINVKPLCDIQVLEDHTLPNQKWTNK